MSDNNDYCKKTYYIDKTETTYMIRQEWSTPVYGPMEDFWSVGGVVGATTGAVGGVVDTTGQVTGQVIATSSQTVNGAAANAKGLIAITSTSSAEASGSSTLSLTGKNMKIEQGSVFSLRTDKSLDLATGQAPKQ
jgi:hypothetical protein